MQLNTSYNELQQLLLNQGSIGCGTLMQAMRRVYLFIQGAIFSLIALPVKPNFSQRISPGAEAP